MNITTREIGDTAKGSPLTNAEIDSNFINLKAEVESKQASNANLAALSGLIGAANKLPYFTGQGAMSLAAITDKAISLLSQLDAPGMRTELGLGSAATATVQTSPTDNTAGRLMAVGAFGVGGDAVFIDDPDTAYRPSGMYDVGPWAAWPNRPPVGGYTRLLHISHANPSGYATQYATAAFEGYSNRHFYRVAVNGTWTPWVELFHTGNQLSLGTTPAEAQTALELVKGTSPGNVLVAGAELVGKHTVECFAFQKVDFASGVTIYTNILADERIMPNLIIRGTLNGYTSPFEAKLSWYFHQGAIYQPNVLITATGGVSGMRFYLRPENGKIVIRIDFGDSFYIPRLTFDALSVSSGLNPDPSMLRGWSAVASNVVGAGEVEAARSRTYHSRNILGTVSQSAGIPTGAIIERGSNANGEFVRFADGTQICMTAIKTYLAGVTIFTWPALFINAPSMSPTIMPFSHWGIASGYYGEYANGYVYMNADGANNGLFVTAIGRWY